MCAFVGTMLLFEPDMDLLLRFGLVVIIANILTSMEICHPENNITMCPLCDRVCNYWKLSSACGTARASHLFDNPATVFFSIFMALWGQSLQPDWKLQRDKVNGTWHQTDNWSALGSGQTAVWYHTIRYHMIRYHTIWLDEWLLMFHSCHVHGTLEEEADEAELRMGSDWIWGWGSEWRSHFSLRK